VYTLNYKEWSPRGSTSWPKCKHMTLAISPCIIKHKTTVSSIPTWYAKCHNVIAFSTSNNYLCWQVMSYTQSMGVTLQFLQASSLGHSQIAHVLLIKYHEWSSCYDMFSYIIGCYDMMYGEILQHGQSMVKWTKVVSYQFRGASSHIPSYIAQNNNNYSFWSYYIR
jgi:hypothetical protein